MRKVLMLHVVIGVLMMVSGILAALIISGGTPLLMKHIGDVVIILSWIVGGFIVAWGVRRHIRVDKPAGKR
jgi:hypothetical protein